MAGKIFVVQKHFARSLHWDFRLELDGVLKSWAVPKEPTMELEVRRLAIQVQDHGMEHAGIEGRFIDSKGGEIIVQIWDRGTYRLIDRKDYKLVFELHGKKLKGAFVLVQMKGRQWLLFKKKD